ncbi:MAG TPA: carboxypeptidase-like regulatory domain-containing protein [Thermoanaerobaculia bacterium]
MTGADGQPVAGAQVALVPSGVQEPGPHRATTGPDGRFTIAGLAPGVYVLRAAHPEHPRFYQAGIDIPDGKGKVDIGGFSLARAQRVEGQVVDQEGRPVAGVRILQERSGPLEIAAAPETDPDGRFVLPEMILGHLTLCKEGYWSVGPVVSPSRPSNLARIVLQPIPPPFRVTGRILDDEGRPVAGARVRSSPHEDGCVVPTFVDACTGERIPDPVVAADADGRFSLEIRERGDFDIRAEAPGYVAALHSRVEARPGQSAGTGFLTVWSDADGRFAAKVSPGTYSLLATHSRYGPVRLESMALAETLDGLEIRLPPGLTLTGRILDLPAGAQGLIRAEQDGASHIIQAGPDGAYRFDNLGPGEWKLSVSVSMKDFHRDGGGSVVLSPETAGRFDFDLALGNASLSGRLGSDDNPILAGIELLTSEGNKIAATGAGILDGEFQFPHLRPGSYILRIKDQTSGRVFNREVEISGDQEIGIEVLE